MNAAEIISRYATPKTSDACMRGAGGGGGGCLSAEEVLGALGCVRSRLGQSLLLVKYADHQDEEERVLELLTPLVAGLMDDGRWPDDPERIVGVMRGALREVTMPMVCKICRGRGSVYWMHRRPYVISSIDDLQRMRLLYPSGEITVCPKCSGLGERRPTITARARACGMHHETFVRGWADPYRSVLIALQSEETKSIREVKMGLYH